MNSEAQTKTLEDEQITYQPIRNIDILSEDYRSTSEQKEESQNFDTAPDQLESIEEIECEVESDEDDRTARSSTININEGERLHQTRHGSVKSSETTARLTDHTLIATVTWSTLKYSAMNSDYQLKPWF